MTHNKRSRAVAGALVVLMAVLTSPARSAPPAEGRILFSILRDGEDYDLYSVAPDGSDKLRLTDTPGSEGEARFSPDGTRIAFDKLNRDGWGIYVMDADGSNVARVSGGATGYQYFPEWSPDGTRIVFQASTDLESDSFLYVVNADGTGLKRLTPLAGRAGQAEWSPDGTRIAYTRYGPGTDNEVWVMNADGSAKTRLTDNKTFETMLEWSPDGSTIVYGKVGRSDVDLMALDVATGTVTALTDTDDVDEYNAAYSPDGRKLAFLGCYGSTCDARVSDADGADMEVVVSGGLGAGPPVWSPDSNHLAYTQIGSGCCDYDLFTLDLSDGTVSPVVGGRHDQVLRSWGPSV